MYGAMAANSASSSHLSYKDVEFTRVTSTNHWARDLNPHSKGGSSGKMSNGSPGSWRKAPSVIRTGGVTGTLPSQPRSRSDSAPLDHPPSPPISTPSAHQPSPPISLRHAHPPPPPITSAAQETPPTTPSATPPRAPRLTHVPRIDQEQPQPKENVSPREKKPLPSADVLDALFDRLTKRMKLPPERVAQLNTRTAERKWSMIMAQNEIQAGIACVFYIEQLVRHAQPELKEKRPKKRLLVNLQPLSNVLTDLEVDLRVNPNDSWVKDFISTPNHGHVALIDLIKDLADTPQNLPRKSGRKYTVLERDPNCLYTALLCLKALMGHRKAFGAVLKYDPSLCVLAYCLDHQSTRIKILILKMMVTVLLAPGGHRKVMQAFDYFRAIMKERTRFQLLMYSLTDEPADPAYQAAVLCFMNTVVQVAQDPNAKVFHQHEFTVAGFNPEEVEKSLHGRQDERILHEIKEWRSAFINVQSYMDNLAVSRGRIRNLQEELGETKQHLKEANTDRESLYKQTRSMIKKADKQKHKLKEADKTIKGLLEVKKERDALLNEKTQLVEAKQKYYTRSSELTERVQTLMEENKALLKREVGVLDQVDSLNNYQTMLVVSPPEPDPPSSPASTSTAPSTPPPATPPPAPPPPPLPMAEYSFVPPPPPPIPFGIPPPPPPPIGGHPTPPGITAKKPIVPNVPLPMLNWFPIKNPEHTIFKDLNDENVMETVDFSEFERLFQVKKAMKKESKRKGWNQRKVAERLTFIETGRNRNLSIAIRRIGRPPESIAKAVECTDLDTLNTEHCELLLKFIPTKEELSALDKYSSRYEDLGEAERFMYHAARVERYEPRLECMAYLGNFDEVLNATQPQINAVLSASLSILRSSRLKKVFEIILAFGNYMNSSRRGAVHGFKLESLTRITDTRSHDKKQTLLNYIVHMVEKVFPNVLTFHEDLDIHAACSVSMAVVSEDVSNLQQGLKVLEKEMEQGPDNFILFSFHKHARKKAELVSSTFGEMQDAYREVCLMFSESPKTTEPADFFGMFAKFTREWKDSVKKNSISSKRSYMASTQDLLKKQAEEDAEEVEPSRTMASLAAEAAAEAAARSEKIRRKVLARDATEREVQSDGELGGRREEEEGAEREEWREGREDRERRDLKRRERKERKRRGREEEGLREEGERGERRRKRREERRGRRKEEEEGEGKNTAESMAHIDTAAMGHGIPECPHTPPLPLATPTHQNNYHTQADYYSHVAEHSNK